MQRLLICVVLAFAVARPALAELDIPKVTYPTLPAEGSSAESFVPTGWKLEAEHKGDLNKDGKDDLVLVLRMNEPRNVIQHDELGQNPFDSNPRILAIAF